jgi:hypothetical protein
MTRTRINKVSATVMLVNEFSYIKNRRRIFHSYLQIFKAEAGFAGYSYHFETSKLAAHKTIEMPT